MDFYCCCEFENISVSDCTSQLYFSENSLYRTGSTQQIFDDMKNQKLQLYGVENYSLARDTLKNIYPKNNSCKGFPFELLQIIVEKLNNIGKELQVFIPYSNDQQLLQYFIQKTKFKIYTLEDDQNYLNLLKKQKIFQQLEFLSQEFNDNFNIKIFNCCSQNKRIFELFQKYQINSIDKNQVFIFDYSTNPHYIISQIMKDQETYKEELMTVCIEGIKKYYLFFTGKLSSTKNFSRLKSIENILLEDAKSKTQIKQMLKILKESKVSYQEILKIIGTIQQERGDELKKQQSDNILSMFLSEIIANEKVHKSKISNLNGYLKQSTDFQSLTKSKEDFFKNIINSYNQITSKTTLR